MEQLVASQRSAPDGCAPQPRSAPRTAPRAQTPGPGRTMKKQQGICAGRCREARSAPGQDHGCPSRLRHTSMELPAVRSREDAVGCLLLPQRDLVIEYGHDRAPEATVSGGCGCRTCPAPFSNEGKTLGSEEKWGRVAVDCGQGQSPSHEGSQLH